MVKLLGQVLKAHSQLWDNSPRAVLFVLKVLQFLFWIFGHVRELPDNIAKVNFKFYDVTSWIKTNYNRP